MTDVRTFASYYETVAPAVYVWVHVHVRQPLQRHTDPADLLQEIWCRAWQGMARFDPERGSFRSWILGIAQNVLLEELRRVARRGGESPTRIDPRDPTLSAVLAEATSLSERAARKEEVQKLLTAADDLPDADRQLLVFVGLEQRPYEEVGQRLGIAAEAARSRWRRLRDRLREAGAARGILAEA